MKKKVWLIIIPILLVMIIIASVIIGILLNNNKSVGSTWGDTYYAYLKEAIKQEDLKDAEEKYGIDLKMKNAKLQFCEVDKNENPSMIMTYTKENSNYVNVYQIVNDEKVTFVSYKQPSNIEFLYNIELKEYIWYIHLNNSNEDSYSSLKNVVDNMKDNSKKSEDRANVNIAELEADYTFKKNEETTVETVEGETLSISKFDETFIKPDVKTSEIIDFDINAKEKDLRKDIETAVDGFKKEEEIVTDQVKKEVDEKNSEISNKKQEMQTAKEEKEKKDAEEKARQEEEARKLTNENVQGKIGENLKWFAAAYMGEVYGWSGVYKYKEVTGTITIPNGLQGAMVYELVGANSKANMKAKLSEYVSADKFSKFSYSSSRDFLDGLTEYNGKVYWENLGVGDGPSLEIKKAQVQSSENGISKVVVKQVEPFMNSVTQTITLTVEHKDGKYLITDWSVVNK